MVEQLIDRLTLLTQLAWQKSIFFILHMQLVIGTHCVEDVFFSTGCDCGVLALYKDAFVQLLACFGFFLFSPDLIKKSKLTSSFFPRMSYQISVLTNKSQCPRLPYNAEEDHQSTQTADSFMAFVTLCLIYNSSTCQSLLGTLEAFFLGLTKCFSFAFLCLI